MPLPLLTATCDLTFEFDEHDGELRGAVEYSTDLFDADTVDRMSRHPLTLLAGVTAEPHRPSPRSPAAW
ncbi:hypothetical protein K7G98_08415 [Saccharothrix sp. MB29]|nr:hypothetical protein [Saccharothrix sp. MB29]